MRVVATYQTPLATVCSKSSGVSTRSGTSSGVTGRAAMAREARRREVGRRRRRVRRMAGDETSVGVEGENKMESFHYAHLPDHLAHVHLALFHNVANAPHIRQRIVRASQLATPEGDQEREALNFAFIDARLVSPSSLCLTGLTVRTARSPVCCTCRPRSTRPSWRKCRVRSGRRRCTRRSSGHSAPTTT